MAKYLLVKGDTNDADYVQSFKLIDDATLASFMPLLQAIKDFKPYDGIKTEYGHTHTHKHKHNFPSSECRDDLGEKMASEIYKGVVSQDVFEHFDDEYVPAFENGIHTIVEIRVFEVAAVDTILEDWYAKRL